MALNSPVMPGCLSFRAVTAAVSVGSSLLPSADAFLPNYHTSGLNSSHFSGFIPCCLKRCNTLLTSLMWSSSDLPYTKTSLRYGTYISSLKQPTHSMSSLRMLSICLVKLEKVSLSFCPGSSLWPDIFKVLTPRVSTLRCR